MIRKTLAITLLLGVSLITIQPTSATQDKTDSTQSGTKVEIRHLLDTYVQSMVDADTKLGATVWSPTPDVSLIEPRGTERGWNQIATVFYAKTMGETFTKRTLKVVGDVNTQIYGNAAVVEFNWDFVGVLRSNGQSLHTTGRESHVYVKLPGKGWRLVHDHYSGPPVTGAGKGF